jgi:hypothetical protein
MKQIRQLEALWLRAQHNPKFTVTTTSVFLATVALLVTFLRPSPIPGSPDFTFDPHFHIPVPPTTPAKWRTIIAEQVVMSASGLIGVLLGAVDAYRSRTLLPFILPISGAFIAFPELMLDVLGGLYHPWSASYPSFHILGREIVPWISVWFGYGAFMQYLLKLLYQGTRTRTLWLFLGLMVLGDLVIEEIFLPMGAWVYYGNQPLRVGSLPWWWLTCNSVGVFLATAVAFRYREFLQGWKAVFVLLITPASVAATYGATALPCWFAVNGDYPWFVTQVLGLITMALGLALFCAVLDLVLGRQAFDLEGRGEGVEVVHNLVNDEESYRD